MFSYFQLEEDVKTYHIQLQVVFMSSRLLGKYKQSLRSYKGELRKDKKLKSPSC